MQKQTRGTPPARRNVSHCPSLSARIPQTQEEIRMKNRLLVSVAAIALIGGVGAVNAQGGMNREGGSAMQQSTPSGGGHTGGAATQKGTEQSYGQKSTQTQPKASGPAKGQRAEDNARGEKSKNLSTE